MRFAASLFAISAVLFADTCSAHQDRVISIERDGTLAGIPAEFGPGKLEVTFATSPQGEKRIGTLVLQLGKNRTEIPRCVTDLINTQRRSDIRAAASWYHAELKELPYYLVVTFYDSRPISSTLRPGYRLLFNLHTAELFRMDAMTVHADGGQDVPVDLNDLCLPGSDLAPIITARGLTMRWSGP